MRQLKQSVAANVMVFVTDSTDHVAGLASATLTITASKDGAAFASISPTVTDRGNGWYSVALTASHTDTLGDLALHITASGADPTDLLCRVVAGSLDADVSSRLATAGYTAPDNATITTIQADTNDIQTRLPAALIGGRIDATVGAMQTDTLTAAALAADAVAEIQSGLSTLDAAGVRASVGLASADLDTQLAALATLIGTRAEPGDAMALTAAAVDAIWDEVLDGGFTGRELMRGFAAALLAKLSGADANAPVFRDVADAKNRITATTDASGNRTAVALDLT